MRAGELRQRITIQQNMPTRDEFNAEVESWSDVATVWANIETLSGAEFVTQQAAGAMLTHQITIRRMSGLRPTMRVQTGAHTFEITAVLDDLAQHQIKLMCWEIVGA